MARSSYEFSRRFEVAAPLQLTMRIKNGRVRVRGGDRSFATIDIKVEVSGRSESDAQEEAGRIAGGITFAADNLRIESPPSEEAFWRRGLTRVEYEIAVPRETVAEINVANGPVRVTDIIGPLDVNLANGPLSVEAVAAATTLKVVNGPLSIRDCRSELHASVVNGPLAAEHIRGPIALKVTNGPVRVAGAELGLSATVLNGPIHYKGPVGGDFDLSARNGGISLIVPHDSRFELDAEAERGRVDSDLTVAEGASGPDGTHRMRLRTERGNIEISALRLPAAAAV